MKKLAIAGASLALAAMPVVGVFADDVLNIKDTLQVTVSSSCTLSDVTPAAASTSTGNAYTGSGAPNELVELSATGGATTFTVKCNANNGYTITPTFSSLTNGTAAHDIAYGSNAAAGSKTWTAYYSLNSGTATAFTASGTAIEGTSTMTDSYVFSYKAGLHADQLLVHIMVLQLTY